MDESFRGEESSEIDEYGVGSFCFKARKPFHLDNFWKFIKEEGNNFLRVKVFWLATRPNNIGIWSQAGHVARFEYGGVWYAALAQQDWPKDPSVIESLKDSWNEIW